MHLVLHVPEEPENSEENLSSNSQNSDSDEQPSANGPMLSTSKAKEGDYPIKRIIRRGVAYHPVTKKKMVGNLVEHEHLIYFDEELDCDLVPEARGPINAPGSNEEYHWASCAPEEMTAERRKRGVQIPRNCRFCKELYSTRDTQIRRERDTCTDPGAPNHLCDDSCPDDCESYPPYEPPRPLPRGRRSKK
uniref:Uncharacterized protein n=1 Tax=Tetranychus urticae TaxID=32264 RepID=T1KK49_TETUR